MKKITLALDDEMHALLEKDRGDLSQQKYIIQLLRDYQLQVVLKKKTKKENK